MRQRRPDPLAGIFNEEVFPILNNATGIRAAAVLEEMLRRHPSLSHGALWSGVYDAGRSRVGPELIFRQSHEPGRMGLPDLTDMYDLGIVVDRQPLDHRLYHLRLVYSGFVHAHLALGSESCELAERLQNAF